MTDNTERDELDVLYARRAAAFRSIDRAEGLHTDADLAHYEAANAAIDDWMRQHDAEVAAKAVEDVALNLLENVDWSDGRNAYGDNAGYEDSARILRNRATRIRREAGGSDGR